MVLEIRLGDEVRLRKPHPCGGYDWRVERLGADIGLRCLKCNHFVLLERPVLERRIKSFLKRGLPLSQAGFVDGSAPQSDESREQS
jgi:hypothetical protein